MKNLLVLLILLVPSLAVSDTTVQFIQPASSCEDCSGTTSHVWYCDNVDVTIGSPCGCSDTDTTMTAVGNAALSSGSAVFNDTSSNGGDYYSCDAASTWDDAGTVFFKLTQTTGVASTIIWQLYSDANDYINLIYYGSGQLRASYSFNGTVDNITTTGGVISNGNTYIIRYRYQTGVAGTDHQITIYNASMVQLDDISEDDDISDFTDEPGAGSFRVGNPGSAVNSNFSVDYINFYSEWVD